MICLLLWRYLYIICCCSSLSFPPLPSLPLYYLLWMPVIRIDPSDIYFTHSKIRHCFSGCGKTIEQTLTELRTGVTKIEAIPKITVYYNGSDYFTQNNRRLYCYKVCKAEGLMSARKQTTHRRQLFFELTSMFKII